MILVVADASPIRYLVVIGAIDVLPRLFERVVIPEYVVTTELRDPSTPEAVQLWAASLPAWAESRSPLRVENLTLHRGETEAIALAKELQAYAVLLDDADARQVAISQGLSVTGTVGILEKAAERRLLNLPEAFQKLRGTNFRADPELFLEALNRDAARQQSARTPTREPGIER